MIEIKSLTKYYGETRVLRKIDATIKDGTIFGLIGINGAGKSTLLKLISGMIRPSLGEIIIDESSPLFDESLRTKIFYLSDQPNYAPSSTLSDLAKLYQVFYPFDYQVFQEISNIFGVSVSTPFGNLSKGMRRQGMIAIAFATGAKYLLLDEVFDGLDPAARLKFKKLMIEYQTENRIFILTSHSLRELEDICDSFGMIDNGMFKKYGDLNDELHKIKKYQVILKSVEKVVLKENHPSYYQMTQEGRVLTLICDQTVDIQTYIEKDNFLACDESPITFEEYFLLQQEVQV
ncbi:MAG: hypothetical protein CVV61_00270 [Tenericutes bacterium HGW-Tenericutes-6]|jgi:ABC-2 type transport system ATP-binding protein|nr:MAG: hypothetical protein CVV61_00270 [Tenericutes bacterium HGW-Tenericutes-6]